MGIFWSRAVRLFDSLLTVYSSIMLCITEGKKEQQRGSERFRGRKSIRIR